MVQEQGSVFDKNNLNNREQRWPSTRGIYKMRIINAFFIFFLTCTINIYAFAEGENKLVATDIKVQAEKGKGAHFRSKYNVLLAMIKAKEFDAAAIRAADLRKEYETIFDKNLKPLVFPSKVEFDDFTKSNPNTYEWIDVSYSEILQMQGFIAAERKNFPNALEISKTIESIAPISAGNAAETGYLLTLMGMPEQGLAAYLRAYTISIKYPSQYPYRAASLRGIGSSLIDLNQLDQAERAFLASLDIDPGNKVAINELAFIRDKRNMK